MRSSSIAVTVLILASFSLVLGACGGGNSSTPASTAPTQPTPSAPTVTGVTVTGPGCANGICSGQVGGTLQMTATAQKSDNTTQDVTASAQWSSSNEAVATVSAAGLVSFRGPGDGDIVAVYQGKLGGQTVRLIPAGPKTSFSAGQYLVGKDVASGRYFAGPNVNGCYWERQRGLSGSLNDVIANDFVGYNAGQIIVDIRSTDLAFMTKSACGTWSQSARSAPAASSITPGVWLVNTQLAPGVYRAQTSPGCYWERLRHFDGTLDGIIANNFVSGGGQQLVELRSSDAGFSSDGDCGTWTRISSLAQQSAIESGTTDPLAIERNRGAHRMRYSELH